MTKKKRLRKERHHQPGNPPPPSVDDRIAALSPTERAMWDALENDLDPDEVDELIDHDPLLESVAPSGPDHVMRPMERNLMRIQRYLEREGITISSENEAEVEALLEDMAWREDDGWPTTPLERAQALVYDAFELPAEDWDGRIELAKRALRISRDCADAHVLLAENEAPSDEAARRRYADAVKAAERAFRDVDIAARPRDFWHLMKIRPLLRAISGLAYGDSLVNNHDRVLDGYRRLFELDHLDVLDARDGYLGILIDRGLDAELIRFMAVQQRLDRLVEDTPHVQYSLVLARFRHEGDSAEARDALRVAGNTHPRILRYLLGLEHVVLDALVFGEDDKEAKAVQYFLYDCPYWLRTPNAIEWLRANAPGDVLDVKSGTAR